MPEVNYPKKYALIKLKEYIEYDEVYSTRIMKTYAYIVGECYLINKITKKVVFDKTRDYYEVVFIREPNSPYEKEPRFYPNNECYNSEIVDEVFDNIEDAIIYRDKRNMMLKAKYIYNSQEKDISKVTLEFLEKLEYAYELEQYYLSNKDIKIKSKTKNKS